MKNGFLEHGVKPTLRYDIDPCAEEILDRLLEADQIEKRTLGLHAHEQVDVAVRLRHTPRDRAKDPNVRDAELARKALNL